jgi:hypothetical protein
VGERERVERDGEKVRERKRERERETEKERERKRERETCMHFLRWTRRTLSE